MNFIVQRKKLFKLRSNKITNETSLTSLLSDLAYKKEFEFENAFFDKDTTKTFNIIVFGEKNIDIIETLNNSIPKFIFNIVRDVNINCLDDYFLDLRIIDRKIKDNLDYYYKLEERDGYIKFIIMNLLIGFKFHDNLSNFIYFNNEHVIRLYFFIILDYEKALTEIYNHLISENNTKNFLLCQKFVPNHNVKKSKIQRRQYSITDLPNECIGLIVNYFGSTKTFFNLKMVNKWMYKIITDNELSYIKCENIWFHRQERFDIVKPQNNVVNIIISNETIKKINHYFINLRQVDFSKNKQIHDGDFIYLKKVRTLIIDHCIQITDKAFKHLDMIINLSIKGCPLITNNAFKYFRKLKVFDMTMCRQLCETGFSFMKNLRVLNLSFCNQSSMTDSLFDYFPHLYYLNISFCYQFSNISFESLKKLKYLDITACNQHYLTDFAFIYLENLETLILNHSKSLSLTDSLFIPLKNLKTLGISYCIKFTDKTFKNFKNLNVLYMMGCNQNEITSKAFRYLKNLNYLNMSYCNQDEISSDAFRYLKNLKYLNMSYCNQNTISHEIFEYLENVEYLNMAYCNQKSIDYTDVGKLFEKLKEVNLDHCFPI